MKRFCRWWLNGLRCCIIGINRALSRRWQLLIQQENSNKYRCGGRWLNSFGGVIHRGEERGTWTASMALPRSEERWWHSPRPWCFAMCWCHHPRVSGGCSPCAGCIRCLLQCGPSVNEVERWESHPRRAAGTATGVISAVQIGRNLSVFL